MRAAVWLIMVLLVSSACLAVTIDNNVVIFSEPLNLTFTVDGELNLSELHILATHIRFENVSYFNNLQVFNSDEISFNITETNKAYLSTDLPYYFFSNYNVKRLTSGLGSVVDGWLFFNVENCYVSEVVFDSSNNTYDKTYGIGEFSCSGSKLRVDYEGLGPGTNTFTLLTSTIATNCSTGNISLEFNIFNEEIPTQRLIADAEVLLSYWQPNVSAYKQNFTIYYRNDSNYKICLSNNVTEFDADVYIKYNTTGGFVHRYYFVNNTLSTINPVNLSLYNFVRTEGISDLKITARYSKNYNYFPDVITKLQRLYVSEDVWRTVQMDKSGDFGLLFFNIIEETTDYRLIFTDAENKLLKQSDTLKFSCTSGICDLTVLLDEYSASTTSGFAAEQTYNNNSGIVTVNWQNNEGYTNQVTFHALSYQPSGTNTLCETTQSGSAGTISCDISGRTGTIDTIIVVDGDVYMQNFIDVRGIKLGTLTGNTEGAIWATLIILTCAMFGIFSPAGAIIAVLIGLIAIFFLGIFTPITVGMLIIITVIAMVIGFKVRS